MAQKKDSSPSLTWGHIGGTKANTSPLTLLCLTLPLLSLSFTSLPNTTPTKSYQTGSRTHPWKVPGSSFMYAHVQAGYRRHMYFRMGRFWSVSALRFYNSLSKEFLVPSNSKLLCAGMARVCSVCCCYEWPHVLQCLLVKTIVTCWVIVPQILSCVKFVPSYVKSVILPISPWGEPWGSSSPLCGTCMKALVRWWFDSHCDVNLFFSENGDLYSNGNHIEASLVQWFCALIK